MVRFLPGVRVALPCVKYPPSFCVSVVFEGILRVGAYCEVGSQPRPLPVCLTVYLAASACFLKYVAIG